MPLLPADAPWSQLFAAAEVRTVENPATLGALLGQEPLNETDLLSGLAGFPSVRVCWSAPTTARVPLAVPPPWTGTLTVSAPAGCREGMLEVDDGFSALLLDAEGLVLDAEVRLGGKRVWRERREPAAPPHTDSALDVLNDLGPELIFTREWIRFDELWLLVGDALPWTRGEEDNGDFADFMDDLGLDVVALASRTRDGPYAGAALEALQRLWPRSGPTPPRRVAQRAALATLDRAWLTEEQRRELAYRLDELAGAPSSSAPAGRATIVVDPHTLELEVGGQVVLTREMDVQVAEILAKRAAPLEVTVDVPAGEAVYVRTMDLGFSAADGGWWHSFPHAAWSALLPGGRYTMRLGELDRVAPLGTTCLAAEGVPEGLTARMPAEEHAARQVVQVDARWPRPAVIRPTEPGRYVVQFQPEGMERVRFEAGACAAPRPTPAPSAPPDTAPPAP